jgi:hypothetical protein
MMPQEVKLSTYVTYIAPNYLHLSIRPGASDLLEIGIKKASAIIRPELGI